MVARGRDIGRRLAQARRRPDHPVEDESDGRAALDPRYRSTADDARMRSSAAVAVLVVLACVGAGCAPSGGASIVALGDSVPHGSNCDCTPFPEQTASDLASSTHRKVTAENDSVSGATTADVLHQVDSDGAVIDHVRHADAVEVEVGANDVGYSGSCGTDVACYSGDLPALEEQLNAIVARIHELTAGRRVPVVLLDYWSVWLGGEYATERGPAYVEAAAEMTDRVADIIQRTAADTGSHYVDLRAAFKGPDYAYDETHFLSDDGDHPNAAGHRRIAEAVEAVVGRPWRR
jgi:lysophospholipase L1-like esterase